MQINQTYKTHEPENGYTKEIRRFALWPVFIIDRWVWLERYYVLKAYIVTTYKVKVEGQDAAFNVGEWKTISKRIKV